MNVTDKRKLLYEIYSPVSRAKVRKAGTTHGHDYEPEDTGKARRT